MLCAGLLLAGCGGPLEVDAPALSGPAAATCGDLVEALPDQVNDLDRRDVEGRGYAAAWGDPAIELRCGVAKPAEIDAFAACTEVDGVGWFISPSQDNNEPVTMTTLNRSVYVSVAIPAEYFPPAATMVDLADAVKRTVRELSPCQ